MKKMLFLVLLPFFIYGQSSYKIDKVKLNITNNIVEIKYLPNQNNKYLYIIEFEKITIKGKDIYTKHNTINNKISCKMVINSGLYMFRVIKKYNNKTIYFQEKKIQV